MNRSLSHALAAALALAAVAVLAPARAGAGPLSLADLEAGLAAREPLRRAEADLAVADAQAARAVEGGGLRGTATAGGGAFTEPQWPRGSRRDFGALSLSLGLRYPVLGSAAEESLAVATSRLDAVQAEARRDAARRALRRELRASAFGYALARERLALADAFLADAPRIREVLRRRQAAGIVLEGDRRQLELGLARAERDREDALEVLRARGEELRRWRGDFDGALALPPPAAPVPGAPALAQTLATRRAAAGADRLTPFELSAPPPLGGVRGNLFVTGTVRRDSDLGGAGALVAGLSLDFPVRGGAGGGALAREREARLSQARLALAQGNADAQREAEAALSEAERAQGELTLARARVATYARGAAEAARRSALASGTEDVPIERWLRARGELYDALALLADAEGRSALAAAQVELAFEGSGLSPLAPAPADACRADAAALLSWRTLTGAPPAAPACAAPAAARAPAARAYYAWDGPRALSRAGDDAFWRETGATELWLSFGAEALERLREPSAREALRAQLERVRARGVRTVLLLGEPGWLLPGRDERLFALVRELAPLPFDAVHLDVEPGQLSPQLPPGQAWAALARLVTRVKALAGRPVLVSIRWAELLESPCPACGAAAAADELVVMCYSTSPGAVAERLHAVLGKRLARRVWLAQSIEPALGPDESFARRGRGALDAQLATLSGLTADPTFAGFAVQSLEDALEARP